MKKLLIFSAVLVGLLLLVTVAGAGMKAQHVAKASRLHAAPSERVWTALLSIRQLPLDRSDLANMESPVEKNRVPASLEVLGSPIRIEAPTQRPRGLTACRLPANLRASPGGWGCSSVWESA